MMLNELVKEARKRIADIPVEPAKLCLMATYLWGARVSEVIGVASGSDTTTPRGPRGTDVSETNYTLPNGSVERVVIFQISTAKRKGMKRFIALPLNPAYEPWTQELCEYFKSKGSELVFPFTRQTVHNYARVAFDGLRYDIEAQHLPNGEFVERHERSAAVHFLRHLRASELSFYYGFRPEDLCVYCGWTFKQVPGMTRMIERYLIQTWQSYFPKLLIPRP